MNYTQPYFNNNQYGYQPMYQPMQPMQSMQQMQRQNNSEQSLQGKYVESLDVVKVIDTPLDGNVYFYPLLNKEAIVTKQLQQDGTSKTIIYKPVKEEELEKSMPKYVTPDELNEAINNIDNSEFKEDIKTLKRKMQGLIEDIQDINNYISKRKDK